jgi:hypothetical protein
MRALRANPAILVAALLALLLLIYVFAGGGGTKRMSQTRCSTREAYDQINRELFRRAAALRPDNESALRQVAAYSVVRRNGQVRRRTESGGTVECSGSIALDLPPGVAGSSGQHSLTANVVYSLAASEDGKAGLREINKADALVQQLADLVEGPGTAQAPAPAQPDTTPPSDSLNAADALPEAPSPADQMPRREARPAPPPPPPPAARPSPPVRRTVSKAPAPAPKPPAQAPKVATAKAAPPEVRAPASPAPPRVATASPSFNCRYARTRGEVAVCRDPGLASLDRQMANQFNRALSRASPGAKLILQRSRTRFLTYRDSCSSDACVADAYQGRINEIQDIATRY